MSTASRIRIHQANIDRYQGLLGTEMTAYERAYVERRIGEEKAAIAELLANLSASGDVAEVA